MLELQHVSPHPPPLHASIVLLNTTIALPTIFIQISIPTPSIVPEILFIVTWRRAVYIGLKICEFPNVAQTSSSFVVIITQDANLHQHFRIPWQKANLLFILIINQTITLRSICTNPNAIPTHIKCTQIEIWRIPRGKADEVASIPLGEVNRESCSVSA